MIFAACGGAQSGRADAAGELAEGVTQTGWRIRGDARAPLNADLGWAAPANTAATLPVERPFRVRFSLETAGARMVRRSFALEYRRNGGPWIPVDAHDFPYPDAATPPVSIVAAGGYPVGSATEALLSTPDAHFLPGHGVSLERLTPPWPSSRVSTGSPPDDTGRREDRFRTEFEWALVLRRFSDGAAMQDHGDRFEFRMTDDAGRPVPGAAHAEVTAFVAEGLLAGTFVETPERIGPWQASDGTLYFLMEPSESDNVLMVVRSVDGGASWSEVDGANRPATGDLEGFATAFRDGRIHMIHQTSDAVFYHAFSTVDDSEGRDRWMVRDERVATPEEPPTQVAALQARADGTLVAFYGGPRSIHFRVRSAQGAWGPETVLDREAPGVRSGPQTVLGTDGTVHLAYTERSGPEGNIWYRRVMADGSLTPRMLISAGAGATEQDAGAVAPLVYLPVSNTVVVLYRIDGDLFERRIGEGGAPTPPSQVTDRGVAQSPVDSDQIGADVVADGETVHVLFIDEGSGGLYHAVRAAAGSWTEARLVQGGIRAQWVRGNVLTREDGTRVYGFVYDAGSFGGGGSNRFGEIVLDAP